MFKSTGLAKMFAGHRKFFRGPHVRHLCFRPMYFIERWDFDGVKPGKNVISSRLAV